jgi:hypothetical protein
VHAVIPLSSFRLFQTPTSKKGRKKGRGKRSSVTSASLQEATTSSRNQIVVETACDAAVEKRKDDLAAQYGLSCSRQDLCTTAQTLLASVRGAHSCLSLSKLRHA